MYSSVLFIVETSLSGFLGSGDKPMSAVESTLVDDVVRNPPGEGHEVFQTELVPQRDELVEAVTASHQHERDVDSVEPVDDVVGGSQDVVHTVLWSHDADVGGEEPSTAAPRGIRIASAQPVGGRTSADDRDVFIVARPRVAGRRVRTIRSWR